MVVLMRKVWMLCVCACHSRFQLHHWLAALNAAKRKPSALVFPASYSLSYNKTNVARYGLLEVADGKQGTSRPQAEPHDLG